MSDRYSKIYTLPNNLYSDGAPVIVSAGALYLDNNTGKCVAQLKIKNISALSIKAASVKIIPHDIADRNLEQETVFQYLDLSVARDEEFGSKCLITLDNPTARSFVLNVTEIVFSNNEIWTSEANNWSSFPSPKPVEATITDEQAIEQYKLEFGQNAVIGYDYGDLWVCACGAVNHADETCCHICEKNHDAISSINIETLKEHYLERKAADEYARKEREAQIAAETEEKKKKIRKTCVIGVPIILIISVLLTIFVFVPNSKLKRTREICSTSLDNYIDQAWSSISPYIYDSKEAFCKSKTVTYTKEKIDGDLFLLEGNVEYKSDSPFGTLYVTFDFKFEGSLDEEGGTGTLSASNANAEFK